MKIDKSDLLWNYIATFLKIASSALLLPLILNLLPSETVGIFVIFMTITALAALVDFGFNSSFTRNVSYIFSGVKELKVEGVENSLSLDPQLIDYKLLKGLIKVMKWFYLRIALILFFILISIGTLYINIILKDYNGDHNNVYIAWLILCIINTYNIYTLYYGALLVGKGLVKKSKQIIIIGQVAYLVCATGLLMLGYGLIAIVTSQAISVIIIRLLSYNAFFTIEISENLNSSKSGSRKKIFNAIYPNSIKVGLTSLGAFMIHRSAIFIGSLYLSLESIASYGITMQIISVIIGLSAIYTSTYLPKISQLRVLNNFKSIKKIYLRGQIILFLTFMIGGSILLFFGNTVLIIIGSNTELLSFNLILLLLLFSFLESNHSIAGGILLTDNKVPFFKASILSGFLTIILLLIFFRFSELGLLSLVLAPGIAQGLYQNWKWPLEVLKDLKITKSDFISSFKILR